MPRAVDGTRRKDRRKKIIQHTKGFYGRRKNLYRTAKDAFAKSQKYAYRDRRNKKREFRKLWIARISAAVAQYDINYSRFISGLNKAEIIINRKVLANLALDNSQEFKEIVEIAKKALA